MRAALVFLLVAAPAFGESKRYPAEPPDPDREAEAHSKLWEDAIDPGRTPYQELVHDAKQLVDEHTPAGILAATDKLDRAVALMPKRPEAYAARGEIELGLKQWKACADDLDAAEQYAGPDDSGARALQHLHQGICEARAGRLADAERTLALAASQPQARSEAWVRLGEVRIAMGKLDEAIGALDTAIQSGEGQSLVRFLLGAAYDRARRPGDAKDKIAEAARGDRTFAALEPPSSYNPYPLLGADEHDYMMGLANRYASENGEPERALVYFRRFAATAPASPWRRRAEEHIKELAGLDYPLSVERPAGPLDVDAARLALRKRMPALRACVGKVPAVFEVTIIRVGPRTPDSVRDIPRLKAPPASTSVRAVLLLDDAVRDDVDQAIRCIEPLVEKTPLPLPKEKDTYYTGAFLVVGS